MKILILPLLLIISFISSISVAEMKPPGTFVPTLCSPAHEAICFGLRLSMEGEYVALYSQEGSNIYQVIEKTILSHGFNPSYSSYNLVLRAHDGKEAQAAVTYFESRPASALLRLQDGREILAESFVYAVTTL